MRVSEVSYKQTEFDFGDKYVRPTAVYFRKALDVLSEVSPRGFEVDKPKTEQASQPILSTDSTERKNTPIWSTVFKNWPLALAALARHCKRGNDKHNPGQQIHWAREKSSDHEDCAARHLVDVHHYNAEIGEYEEACALVFRGMCILQLLEEKRLGKTPK